MMTATGNPLVATFMSFLVGTLAFLVVLPFSGTGWKPFAAATSAPWWAWTAGLMGAFYVGSLVVLVPRLGVAWTFALVVAGQMLFSLLIDSNGWLGVPMQQLSWGKVAGALLIVAGVALMRFK